MTPSPLSAEAVAEKIINQIEYEEDVKFRRPLDNFVGFIAAEFKKYGDQRETELKAVTLKLIGEQLEEVAEARKEGYREALSKSSPFMKELAQAVREEALLEAAEIAANYGQDIGGLTGGITDVISRKIADQIRALLPKGETEGK